jgi:hypothetical protein
MNNNQLFDEHIKEQFSNYAPDVPPRIWENIIAEREKRRPVGFWFTLFNGRNILLFLGLLLAGGSGAWLLFKKSPTPTNNEKNTAQSPVERNKLTSADPSSSSENKNNNLVTVTDPTTGAGTTSILNEQNNTIANNPSRELITGKTAAVTAIRIYSPSLPSSVNDDPAKHNKKGAGFTSSLNKNNVETGDAEVGYDNIPVQGTLLSRLIYGAQLITATKKQTEELKTRSPFGFLPGCPAFEKDAAGNKKYFEFYAGPDFAIRSLSDTGNSAYLQKRKESSKVSFAYSAGVRYTKVFNNSMSLSTGINYSQINEKFTFVQGNLVQVTYIINANGDTTGSYITRGTRYKTTHNKYRSIDIPLLVGYEMGNGRLHANIHAGVVMNVYSWQKGEVLDTTYQPVTITTGKGSSPYQFKTNAGLGFMGGASVFYKLNDNLHVMAEPYFRYNFAPMNTDNLTLKQKYSTVGLRLGVRVDLR